MVKKRFEILILVCLLTFLIVSIVSFAGDFNILDDSTSGIHFMINGTSGNLGIGTQSTYYAVKMNMYSAIGFKLGGSYGILNSNCRSRFGTGRGGLIFGGGAQTDCTSGGNKAYKIVITDDGFVNDYGMSFNVEVNDVDYENNIFINGRSGKVGYVGIGTGDPEVKLDVDSNSNTQAIRLHGASETAETADIFVSAEGALILTTMNTTAINSYIEVDGEDNQFGFIIRDSNTGSTQYANLYMTDAATDYLNIVVNDAVSTPGLVITSAQNVGIGTATPLNQLTVIGESNFSTNLIVGSNVYIGHSSGSNDDFLYFDAGSNYINWSNAADYFYFSNDLQVNAQISMASFAAPGSDPMCWDGAGSSTIGDCSSLSKYKENIRDYTVGLNDVLGLRPRIYDWKNASKNKAGFIAEEVEASIPSLAKYRDGNLSGYQEFGMSAALVNSIKELKSKNDLIRKELCNKDTTYTWC